jgi:hypothetical protein
MKKLILNISGKSLRREKCLSPNEFEAYLKDNLTREELQAVEWHLSECPLCSDALDGFLESKKEFVAEMMPEPKYQVLNVVKKNPYSVIFSFANIAALFMIFLTVTLIWFLAPEKTLQTESSAGAANTTPDILAHTESEAPSSGKSDIPEMIYEEKKASKTSTSKVQPVASGGISAPTKEDMTAEKPVLALRNEERASEISEAKKDEETTNQNIEPEKTFDDEDYSPRLDETRKSYGAAPTLSAEKIKRERSSVSIVEVEKLLEKKQTKLARKRFEEWKIRNASDEGMKKKFTEVRLLIAEKKYEDAQKLLLELKEIDRNYRLKADSLLKIIEAEKRE